MTDVTPTVIFDQMKARFIPDGAGDWDAKIQFNLSGDNGGNWTVIIKDKAIDISEGGEADEPTCTINCPANTWVGMTTGEVNPMMAFTSGQLVVKGNMGDAMKLNNPQIFKRD